MKKAHKFQIFKNSDKSNQHISQKTDSGRSMVEMLGVLAVIGVLSVASILGYRYAMDKYKANQTVNDVNLRVLTIETQLAQGIDMISLNEFDIVSTVGYTFTEPEEDEEGNILFSVEGLEKNVCQMVKEGILHYKIIINDEYENTNCMDLEEGNKLTLVFENETIVDTTPACPEECQEDEECQNGVCGRVCHPECIEGKCINGHCICPDGYESCSEMCCEAGYICSSNRNEGECIKATGCTRNEDCADPDKYCKIQATRDETVEGCYKNYKGTCQNKGKLPTGKVVEGIGTVYLGTIHTTWWSARNWCLAHGKRLIDISGNRLHCNLDGSNETKEGYCCSTNQSCGPQGPLSQRMAALKAALDGNYVWTNVDDGACKALDIYLRYGNNAFLASNYKDASGYSYFYTLCE